ncbi:MAG: hypothetical protein RL380_832 [Verrucomicrobiota bacterium]|jgi:N-acetylglutamate synthase-like GNAT family acetyltransferase
MNSPFQIRRCVIDDLPALLPLWRSMEFPAAELEKRFAEFQVAVDGQGQLLGAIGFSMTGKHGWIRHEAFVDFGLADELRGWFWQRLQKLATNHGLHRLWTREDSHFWRELEFLPAETAALEKLPAEWRADADKHPWLTLPLPAEVAMQKLAQTGDVEALLQLHRDEAAATEARVKFVRSLATGVALLLALFVGALLVYVFRRDPGMLRHFFGGQ